MLQKQITSFKLKMITSQKQQQQPPLDRTMQEYNSGLKQVHQQLKTISNKSSNANEVKLTPSSG